MDRVFLLLTKYEHTFLYTKTKECVFMFYSIIGAFLNVYIMAITMMTIIGYPLKMFIDISYPRYFTNLVLLISQCLTIVLILQLGHIIHFPISQSLITLFSILHLFYLIILAYSFWHSSYQEQHYFTFPLYLIIIICFIITLWNI